MLEFLRRSATSVFSWIILGVLALVFGLSFGLPSESLTFGTQPLVKVHGDSINDDEYRYQLNLMSRILPIPEDPRMQELMGVKEEVLEAAVERRLLAHIAEEAGLEATQWDAETLVLDGHVIALGDTFDWIGKGDFDYELFTKAFLRSLQVSEPKYLGFQEDELLARTLRDLVAAATVVPEAQIREAYEGQANRLSLRYVRFAAEQFADLVDPTEDEIERYVSAHRDELRAQLQREGMRFTKLPRQARVALIAVPKEGAISQAPAGEAAANAALRRIRAGEDFRTVAREVSVHETARRGGDYGWVNLEGTGSGLDPAVDQALTSLEPGEISEVLEGEAHYFVLRVRGVREGDVPEEEALRELGEEALRRERGRDLARQAAQEALLAAKAGKKLDDLFPTPSALTPEGSAIESLGSEASEGELPRLRITGLYAKEQPIPGIGNLPELTKMAWATDENEEILDRVFESGNAFIVAGIERKEVATPEGFAERREEILDRLVEQKANAILANWTKRACLEAKAEGDIVPAQERLTRLLVYDTKEGSEGSFGSRPYSVCDRVGMRGGLLRTGLMQAPGGAGS